MEVNEASADHPRATGYKQTEVGLIPEDWRVKPLGDLFNFSGGYTASRDQLSTDGYCYLHYGDIHTSNKTFIDARSEYRDIPKLNIPLKKVSSVSLLDDGDVVFVDASEDDEGTSKHVVISNPDRIPFISGLHTIVAKSRTNELDHQYRRYCFQTRAVKAQFRFYAVGTKVSGISKTNIAKVLLPVPTKAEQEAIAEALSDADALIESLERLLTKKRHLKQGAMQELLTGKKRLPGFSGEWEVKQLRELADIRSGGTPSTTQPQFWDGDILWCTPTDITGLNGFKYLNDTSRKISLQGLKSSSAEMIPANSIVMTSRATIGECAINTVPVSTNQGFKNFIPFDHVDVEFLYYLLLTQKQGFISLCGGSTFLEIGKTQLAVFEVKLPAEKTEQTAIATILSDMDVEIAALEEKLAKARNLKQGMMQELLTGRIRLV
ncbi:MAG: restriction endonuclease subunit S [Gammaproteobacteria bacterium]|nr:restriction endonuclease subunit S [Gammaproteobacteria bacterium]